MLRQWEAESFNEARSAQAHRVRNSSCSLDGEPSGTSKEDDVDTDTAQIISSTSAGCFSSSS